MPVIILVGPMMGLQRAPEPVKFRRACKRADINQSVQSRRQKWVSIAAAF